MNIEGIFLKYSVLYGLLRGIFLIYLTNNRYKKFDGQTLIISKYSSLKINNEHKKGKDLNIIYLHIKRLQIFLRKFDLKASQYVNYINYA